MLKSHNDQRASMCCSTVWGAVLCLLVLLSSVKCDPMTLEELESVLNSHNQSLMKVNSYLTRVDKFYHWYSANHRRLDSLVAGSSAESAVEGGTAPSDEAMQDLTNRLQLLENASRTRELQWVQHREQQALHLSTLEAQLKQLEEQLREKDDRIEELNSAVTSTTTMDNLTMFIRQMAAKSNRSIEELATNLTRVADKIDQSESQIERVVAESSKAVLSSLEARIQTMESSRNLSLENAVHLDETVSSMKDELQHVINKTDQYDTLQQTLNTLQSKAEQFEADRRGDKNTMDRMERSLKNEFSSIGETVQQSTSRTEEALQAINQDMSQVKGSLLRATTERTTFSEKVNGLQEGSRNTNVRFESIQGSLQMLGTKTSGLDTTISNLQGSLSRLESRIDGFQQTTTTTQTTVNTLTARVDDLAGEVKTVGERGSASVASEAALQEIRNKLQEVMKMVSDKSRSRETGDEIMSRVTALARGGGARGRSTARGSPLPSTLAIGG